MLHWHCSQKSQLGSLAIWKEVLGVECMGGLPEEDFCATSGNLTLMNIVDIYKYT